MFGDDLIIKKYPYLGYSPNLLEYFSIIGYEESYIEELKFKNQLLDNDKIIPPTILFSVISNREYGIIDNDLIIKLIFPENPKILSKNPPNIQNIIYSFCFDSYNGDSKLFYICFAYIFYESYDKYFIPKAFCIVSQFPYFTSFKYLCKNFKNLFIKQQEIPQELLIYNLVNFVPSPISFNIHLDLFNSKANPIDIFQLSGYPYMDFNFSDIFNILPLNFFIEIFIFSILEESMLFFSNNLEFLNMTMYILYILNYPCNDSPYFWHIVSVSKDALTDSENKFVNKPISCMLGVNCSYNENINTNDFSELFFVVDLDNKKIYLKKNNECEENDYEKTKKIQEYIEKILDLKTISSKFLKNFLNMLTNNLKEVLNLNTSSINLQDNSKSNFFNWDKTIHDKNRRLQEIFYDFYLSILMIFYRDNTLSANFDKIKKEENNSDNNDSKKYYFLNMNDNTDFSNEEKIFCEKFRVSNKYQVYLCNFIQEFKSLEVFKIPLMFSEELINAKMQDEENLLFKNIKYFDIIDSFYYIQCYPLNITLNNFYSEYQSNFYKYFKMKPNTSILINLDKNIVNKYIYMLNNKLNEDDMNILFPSICIIAKGEIHTINRQKITDIIEEQMYLKGMISNETLLFHSTLYVFSMLFGIIHFSKMMTYLTYIRDSFKNLKFFVRKYIYIILMTLYKFLLLNPKNENMTGNNIKMYYFVLVNYLRQTMIIPNEEMMVLLGKFLNEKNYEDSTTKIDINSLDNNYININNLDKSVFQYYMANTFTYNGNNKLNEMIQRGINEKNDCNIKLISKNKIIEPMIIIKIFNTVIKSPFYSPKKILRITKSLFDNFINDKNLDIYNVNLNELVNIMSNLIIYGVILGHSKLPFVFIINALYQIKCYLMDKEKEEKENKKNESENNNKEDNKKENEIKDKVDNKKDVKELNKDDNKIENKIEIKEEDKIENINEKIDENKNKNEKVDEINKNNEENLKENIIENKEENLNENLDEKKIENINEKIDDKKENIDENKKENINENNEENKIENLNEKIDENKIENKNEKIVEKIENKNENINENIYENNKEIIDEDKIENKNENINENIYENNKVNINEDKIENKNENINEKTDENKKENINENIDEKKIENFNDNINENKKENFEENKDEIKNIEEENENNEKEDINEINEDNKEKEKTEEIENNEEEKNIKNNKDKNEEENKKENDYFQILKEDDNKENIIKDKKENKNEENEKDNKEEILTNEQNKEDIKDNNKLNVNEEEDFFLLKNDFNNKNNNEEKENKENNIESKNTNEDNNN